MEEHGGIILPLVFPFLFFPVVLMGLLIAALFGKFGKPGALKDKEA